MASMWVICPDCEDWWCRKHKEHVGDCDCPTLDELIEDGVDPYLDEYNDP